MTLRAGITSLCCLAATALLFAVAPDAAAQGWLVAFLVGSSICIGSIALMLIHRLTGGAWGHALAPELIAAMRAMPVLAAAFIPIVLARSHIYPAPPASSSAGAYLASPFFLLRNALALGGWCWLAMRLQERSLGRLGAALGLVFHGIAVSVVSVDWIASLDPPFTSSAFGAALAIQQILAALAFAAMFARTSTIDGVGSFLLAAVLGLFYLELTSFIVIWYGNLPEEASWYLRRASPFWSATLISSGALALVCLSILLSTSLRASARALTIAGAGLSAASVLHLAWLAAPRASHLWILAMIFALGAMASLSCALKAWRPVHVT